MTSPRTTRAACAAAVWALCACGAAPQPDLNEAFRRIQIHEATIARSAEEAEACEDPSCPAATRICDAAASICGIADEIDDADARARCGLARRRCPTEAP